MFSSPAVIQKIAKTFADPNETEFDPETLKSIIARLDGIEKNLENIIYMNAQSDSISAVQMNGLLNRQFITAAPGTLTTAMASQSPPVEPMQVQQHDEMVEFEPNRIEIDSDDNDLIGEFIEQDELKLVEFPINRVDDLRELEESITTDQESFVSFVSLEAGKSDDWALINFTLFAGQLLKCNHSEAQS